MVSVLYGQNIFYVKVNGTGAGIGGRELASGDLQATINIAGAGDEIWVAEYTYQHALNLTFIMKHRVALYGGFDGAETNRTL